MLKWSFADQLCGKNVSVLDKVEEANTGHAWKHMQVVDQMV